MPTVTISGTDYDVYADVATADVWLNASMSADAWRSANADKKAMALVTATRWIDSQEWKGEKTDAAQPLAWPRTGIDGVDSATVPDLVVQACIELAGMLVANPALIEETQAGGAAETKRLKAGSAEIEYFRSMSAFKSKSTIFPMAIFNLLKQWLAGFGTGGPSGSESYDTCRPSAFRYGWGFTDGIG